MSEEKNETEVSKHHYDGIYESDNPMPYWWIWSFILTVIFGSIYYLHYEVSNGPSLKQELAEAMKEIESRKGHVTLVVETEESLIAQMKSPEDLALGVAVYNAKCAMCHGQDLQGQIGPNLTDRYWIHGKGLRTDLVKIIHEGIPEKGMPPWRDQISKKELYGVIAYIISKIDSNPKNAKAPQGDLASEN